MNFSASAFERLPFWKQLGLFLLIVAIMVAIGQGVKFLNGIPSHQPHLAFGKL